MAMLPISRAPKATTFIACQICGSYLSLRAESEYPRGWTYACACYGWRGWLSQVFQEPEA